MEANLKIQKARNKKKQSQKHANPAIFPQRAVSPYQTDYLFNLFKTRNKKSEFHCLHTRNAELSVFLIQYL